MKRIISLFLALVMISSAMCMFAYAETFTYDDLDESTEVDVQIKANEGGLVHKYSFDIEYPDDMVFTYSRTSSTWDPKEYAYTAGEGIWDSKKIKITNHSDLPIKYAATASVSTSKYGPLGITFTGETGEIAACQPGMDRGELNATIGLTISGTPDDDLKETAVTLGKITIKFAEV